jgi:hypothetical protein
MEIDNARNATRAKMLLISLPFVLVLVTGLLAIFLIIFTWIPLVISGVLMIAGWAITVVLRMKSVKFRFTDESVSVLYYPISPMTSNYKRIEIPAGQLLRFEIINSFMGLRKELALYENISGQEASYPLISITLCSNDDIRRIEEHLSAYCSAGTSS